MNAENYGDLVIVVGVNTVSMFQKNFTSVSIENNFMIESYTKIN
jgi:hypothetical protein